MQNVSFALGIEAASFCVLL